MAKGIHQTAQELITQRPSVLLFKLATIRVVLTIAVQNKWNVLQLDVNNGFLNGMLQGKIYMVQPEGFKDQTKPGYVCRLQNALYGLKQAQRAWLERLKGALLHWGFENAKFDVFVHLQERRIINHPISLFG